MATPGSLDSWSARAEATFAAITSRKLYSPERRLFGERQWVFWRTYEHLWPFANAWSAIATLAAAPGQPGALAFLRGLPLGLTAYHRAHRVLEETDPVGFESTVVPPLGPGGEVYFDDNAWLALALLAEHRLQGDRRALSLAQRLFAFVLTGWSTEASWRWPGGIRWKQPNANVSRNTCSNAPVAEVGALLHQVTGDQGALAWAQRIYQWVRSALLGPGDLYLDHLAPDGTPDETVWSYNQGTMVGAGVLLFQATGEHAYLEQAEATAAACLARFDLAALVEHNGPAFDAVLFRNLLLLDATAPNPAYARLATTYAEAMWQRRDGETGLFPAGPSPLNASAPLLEIFALLAGAPAHP